MSLSQPKQAARFGMTQRRQSSTLCPSGTDDDFLSLNLRELYTDALFTSGSFNELAVF